MPCSALVKRVLEAAAAIRAAVGEESEHMTESQYSQCWGNISSSASNALRSAILS